MFFCIFESLFLLLLQFNDKFTFKNDNCVDSFLTKFSSPSWFPFLFFISLFDAFLCSVRVFNQFVSCGQIPLPNFCLFVLLFIIISNCSLLSPYFYKFKSIKKIFQRKFQNLKKWHKKFLLMDTWLLITQLAPKWNWNWQRLIKD